jgi:DNA-binding response OmpR family regulator
MRTMLIVEDDPAWRGLYAEEFKPRFKLLEAGDGLEALAVLERARPDIVVLDLRLPRMNGLDFLRALDRLGLRMPVVVCSGLTTDEGDFPVQGVRATRKTADLEEVRAAVEDAFAVPKVVSARPRAEKRSAPTA